MSRAPLLAICVALIAYGQPDHADSKFDVASVKVSSANPGQYAIRGGPGTDQPERFSARNPSLFNLLLLAYNIKYYQLSGPSWLATARFDIEATIAPHATHREFTERVRNLLVERFRLSVHYGKKEVPGYELTDSKRGARLRVADESRQEQGAGGTDMSAITFDPEGYPVFPASNSPVVMANGLNGRRAMRMRGQTMNDFVDWLTKLMGGPVSNGTSLNGKYDFALRWVSQGAPDADEGPDMASAIGGQLGLRLQPKLTQVNVVVVDHIDHAPTAN
jgi:uncharacterized protein (TIGR03435 family)